MGLKKCLHSAVYGHLAGDAGLEPTLTESKSVVLPIRRIPNIKLGANYLCPEIGIEPIFFAFEANVLTF